MNSADGGRADLDDKADLDNKADLKVRPYVHI